MNFYIPDNIFARLLANCLPDELRKSVIFLASSMLSKHVNENENSVALIPTTDLITHKEFYVSGKFGIAFEGLLSNSYFYFSSGKSVIKEILLFGDISSLEAIISKILFKEVYNFEVSLKLETNIEKLHNKSYLISGDENLKDARFKSGVSFAEEILEALSLPFVNYVLASKDERLIEQFNSELKGVSDSVYDKIENGEILPKPEDSAEVFIKENVSSFIMDFEEQDLDAITELLRLPYFHGLVKDITEVKFV